jgi:hypothetical protein
LSPFVGRTCTNSDCETGTAEATLDKVRGPITPSNAATRSHFLRTPRLNIPLLSTTLPPPVGYNSVDR